MADNFAESFLSKASEITKSLVGSQQALGFSMEEIGKPYRFAESVDPQERAYRFLATRMNCVDIYPCNYAMSYLYKKEDTKQAESKGKTSNQNSGISKAASGAVSNANVVNGSSNNQQQSS